MTSGVRFHKDRGRWTAVGETIHRGPALPQGPRLFLALSESTGKQPAGPRLDTAASQDIEGSEESYSPVSARYSPRRARAKRRPAASA